MHTYEALEFLIEDIHERELFQWWTSATEIELLYLGVMKYLFQKNRCVFLRDHFERAIDHWQKD